ncbi:putative amino acid transporter, transmembrane domain-containing protein [Helianthus annuus]|nr:putative amino acid transporter, transmembrane domain-containing protein [Helianthus annuus]KAJ0723478.1 putative amino acid transporter, transmembrane domain-containing protein [Helianthus annuus]KAJ0899272.1 putative amino acid transporter, transmembrane domain-containing protein [Helianthus annuus]
MEIEHKGGLVSAHTIDRDSWKQVGLLLVTGYSCGYILSFSNLMLVPLGWTWGIISLIAVAVFAAYSSWLLAGFHFINGQRFIRFRDLMGSLFGQEMFYVTWVSQILILLITNMGFILLGGKALKEINAEFGGSSLRLQYFIIITGVAYFVFSIFVPTISSMGKWLIVSTILTFTYIGILLAVVIKDGLNSNRVKDYQVRGSDSSKMFNAFCAISAIVACNSAGIIPEIQSTLRSPAVENMRKALHLQFTIGLTFYYGVSIVGYWSYGSAVSEYLPENITGPTWAKVLINAVVFTQSIISQHAFIAPVHEALDTKFLILEKGIHSRANIFRLLCLRALLFTLNTLVAAAIPFMGDFVNLLGSFLLIPLTFVFPSMIFIKVKREAAKTEKVWHWAIIVLFSLLMVVTTIAAVRLIVNNISEYHLFADTRQS